MYHHYWHIAALRALSIMYDDSAIVDNECGSDLEQVIDALCRTNHHGTLRSFTIPGLESLSTDELIMFASMIQRLLDPYNQPQNDTTSHTHKRTRQLLLPCVHESSSGGASGSRYGLVPMITFDGANPEICNKCEQCSWPLLLCVVCGRSSLMCCYSSRAAKRVCCGMFAYPSLFSLFYRVVSMYYTCMYA